MSTKTPREQLHDLRQAVLAIADSLGAALPHTPDVVATLTTLANTPAPVCPHCDGGPQWGHGYGCPTLP